MAPHAINPTILRATGSAHPLDLTYIDEEDMATPWQRSVPSSGKLPGVMPKSLNLMLANRLICLAAF